MKKLMTIVFVLLWSVNLHAQTSPCGTIITSSMPLSLAKGAAYVDLNAVDFVDIGVAVHIVRNSNGTGGLSPALVDGILANLNASFSSAKMRFFMVSLHYIDDNYFAVAPGISTPQKEDELTAENNAANVVNLYFVPYHYAAGTGTFSPEYQQYTNRTTQSVIIQKDSATLATTPHEFGHYFNLFHTFETVVGGVECPDGSNSASAGDLIVDTYAEPVDRGGNFNASCLYEGNSNGLCNGQSQPYHVSGLNQVNAHNYMSYAPQGCRTVFTNEQNRRIRTQFETRRPELQRGWVTFTNRIGTTNAGGSLLVDNSVIVQSGNSLSFSDKNSHPVKTQNERFSTYKHHNWNGDVTKFHLNTSFNSPPPNFKTDQNANFTNLNPATLRVELIDGGSGGTIDFRDPWYLHSDNTQPNTYFTYNSPHSPTGAFNQSSGGIFLNQLVDANKPYYSIRVSQNPTIGSFNWSFQNWTTQNASLTTPNNIVGDFYETSVVFNAANAEVKARYKAKLGSNLSSATAANGQRKLVYTNTTPGKFHLVYESAGEIYYTFSTDNGVTWSNEILLSSSDGNNKFPSIAAHQNKVYVIWQRTTSTNNYTIYARRYTGSSWASRQTLGSASLTTGNNPLPVITLKEVNVGGVYKIRALAVWKGGSALRFRTSDQTQVSNLEEA